MQGLDVRRILVVTQATQNLLSIKQQIIVHFNVTHAYRLYTCSSTSARDLDLELC
jgi:hypothetical protein